MKYYIEDINNFRGVESSLLEFGNVDHMQRLADILTDRVVNIGCTMIGSDKTQMVAYNRDTNEFYFYECVNPGLFKHFATMSVTVAEGVYVFVRENVLVQGHSVDDEGNVEVADIVGIEVNLVEYGCMSGSFDYNEADCKGITEEMLLDNELYNCDNYLKIEKVNGNNYVSI